VSSEGITLKLQQERDWFEYQADSVKVTVVDGGREFHALFDNSYSNGNADKAHVKQHKRVPRLTCFSGDVSGLENSLEREDVLSWYDEATETTITMKVNRIETDLTSGTYQAAIWLIKS